MQVGHWDGSVAVWQILLHGSQQESHELRLLAHITADIFPIRSVTWLPQAARPHDESPDFRHIFATAGHSSTLKIWDSRCASESLPELALGLCRVPRRRAWETGLPDTFGFEQEKNPREVPANSEISALKYGQHVLAFCSLLRHAGLSKGLSMFGTPIADRHGPLKPDHLSLYPELRGVAETPSSL